VWRGLAEDQGRENHPGLKRGDELADQIMLRAGGRKDFRGVPKKNVL